MEPIKRRLKGLKKYELQSLAKNLGLENVAKSNKDQLVANILDQCSREEIRAAMGMNMEVSKKKWWQTPIVIIIGLVGSIASIIGLLNFFISNENINNVEARKNEIHQVTQPSLISKASPGEYKNAILNIYAATHSIMGSYITTPYLAAIDADTLPTRYDIFFRQDWLKFIKTPRNESLDKQDSNEEDDASILGDVQDDLLYFKYKNSFLPGTLVFIIQNSVGSKGPTIVIEAIEIHSSFSEIQKPSTSQQYVVITRQAPHFAEEMPIQRGFCQISPKHPVSAVSLPSKSKPETGLFRDRLEPGEESLYLVDVVTNFNGYAKIILNLVVKTHCIGTDQTKRVEFLYENMIEDAFICPSLDVKLQHFMTVSIEGFQGSSIGSRDELIYRNIGFWKCPAFSVKQMMSKSRSIQYYLRTLKLN